MEVRVTVRNRLIRGGGLLLTWIFASTAPAGAEAGNKVRALVVPERETTIASQLSGKILTLNDQVGGAFSKGETLATFDCAELVARQRMADAELQSADVTLKAKKELFRLQSAGETELALAEAALAKARAQQELGVAQVANCTIAAPFDGTVVKVSARPFQSVNLGQPLLEIVSRDAPKARMNIPSSWLSWLKKGARFRFAADETGRSYEGVVTHISGKVDAVSQTIEVEGRFAADAAGLVAGMSGFASFQRGGRR